MLIRLSSAVLLGLLMAGRAARGGGAPRVAPAGALPSPEPSRPLQRAAIGVAGGASLSWLPSQLAAVLGYYREEGIDVEFVRLSGTSVVPALLSGELLLSTVISPVGANAGQGGDTRLVQFHAI